MSTKLGVKPITIFGSGVPASGNVAQPGSTKAGSTVYSQDPTTLQALAAWANGLTSQLIDTSGGQNSQVLEELNGILFVLTYQLAYLKQAGVAEWDPTVPYFISSFAVGSDGKLYVSKTNSNINNDPTADATNWQTFASTLLGASDPLLKAWVVFDGRTGVIDTGFNVASITRLGAGKYRAAFSSPLASAFYGLAGTAGTRPGQAWIPGDDNHITAGMSGQTPARTTSLCDFFCYDRGDNVAQDSSMISVNFFGP